MTNAELNKTVAAQQETIAHLRNRIGDLVDELATSVDFRCEDCDDRDVDQISLAYSLLEALKHI